MLTLHKQITVGELFGALSGVPLHTPVTVVASINASIDEADNERGYVDYEGRLHAVAVVRHLNEVTIEAVEP